MQGHLYHICILHFVVFVAIECCIFAYFNLLYLFPLNVSYLHTIICCICCHWMLARGPQATGLQLCWQPLLKNCDQQTLKNHHCWLTQKVLCPFVFVFQRICIRLVFVAIECIIFANYNLLYLLPLNISYLHTTICCHWMLPRGAKPQDCSSAGSRFLKTVTNKHWKIRTVGWHK